MTAGTCPDAPIPVRTERMLNGLDQTKCLWPSPNNNGFVISGYTVHIRAQNQNNGFEEQFVNVARFCQENLNNADIIQGNECTISEATLRAMPFNLPEQAEVICEVTAIN